MPDVVCRVRDQTSRAGRGAVARQNGDPVLCRERHDRWRLRQEVWLNDDRLVAIRTHGPERVFEFAWTIDHQRVKPEPCAVRAALEVLHEWRRERIGLDGENGDAGQLRNDLAQDLEALAAKLRLHVR